jgi:Flp pilus assembly protein TadG
VGRRFESKARHRSGERGASLVEFAIMAPLLILLLLGIVEFGWVFAQNNDVRHGAREGARFAAVDAGNNAAIRTYVCQTMEGLSAGITTLEVGVDQGSGIRGGTGSITVRATIASLSGAPVISSFLPTTLESVISFRLEQDADSWNTVGLTAVTC